MLIRRFGITLAALALCVAACAQALGIKGEDAASIGIHIQNIATGKVAASRNAASALIPASILKAYTSATVMSVFGPDRRAFATEVWLKGCRSGDKWIGDIVVKASGDPTLDSRHFKELPAFCPEVLQALEREGISAVGGDVKVESRGSYYGVLPSWEVEDVGCDYGAGLWGFNWKDNTFSFSLDDGITDPWMPGFRFTMLPAAGKGVLMMKGAGSDSLAIYSSRKYDAGHKFFTTMSDPAAAFADNLRLLLAERGVEVSGDEYSYGPSVMSDSLLLVRHESPAVSDILESLMRRSDNMMAEGMLRSLEPEPVSVENALAIQDSVWTSRGIKPEFADIRDGSGLSRADRIQPEFLGKVLRYMARSEFADDYVALFPRCGRDGTVQSFLKGSRLAGKLRLKTGSMSGVQCYAGYLTDASGRPTHSVVVMVNGFFCPRADLRKAIERYLLKILP